MKSGKIYIPFTSGGLSSAVVNALIAAAIAVQPEVIGMAVTDETSVLTSGTAKITFRMPFAMTLTEVRASLNVAADDPGDKVRVNIKQNGVSIFSTQLTIDNLEKTSVTASTPAVISTPSLADDAEMTVDLTVGGTSGTPAGLKIWLIGTRT